jgi:hypothetical protein
MTTSHRPRNYYMLPAKAAPFKANEFASRLQTAGRAASFRAERYVGIGGGPLIAPTKRTLGPYPQSYLSAGRGREIGCGTEGTRAEAEFVRADDRCVHSSGSRNAGRLNRKY